MDVRMTVPMFLDKVSEAAKRMQQPGDMVITAESGEGEQIDRVAPLHQALAAAVETVVKDGHRPTVILGDCCQVIAIMAGIERTGVKPSLLWLDSHGDFNTWETTPSGFLGGMPLAMLTGRGDQRMLKAVGLSPIVDQRVVLSDGRDLDPGERDLVMGSGIAFLPQLEDLDPENLPDGPLYLHFDSDIIDASVAPAFLYPVTGGPSIDTIRRTLAAIMATGRVMAVSTTVGWNTAKDADGKTENAVRAAMRGLSEP